ncbi:hypothetical protein [Azospirillum sp. SYSU D00513]|uniref:hypothetical protein n=1 Tax=Azospirillum sp. SYSU D00513 TaxID=2812561 RepID=UPI001A96FCD1|nr:hypothetical protein [Azospirillum sp. SYSU D00513]
MGIVEFRRDIPRRGTASQGAPPPDGDIAPFAERVAALCRNRMLESGNGAVALLYIENSLASDPEQVLRAVRWLERTGRAEVREFSLRTRPHVTVPAVCRIDDIGPWSTGKGTA